MADPFSIAGGCIALATTGIQLAESLYEYTKLVREADNILKPIADHIQLTAAVLSSVGTLVKTEATKGLYTDDLLQSTNATIGGCETAFGNFDQYVRLHFKKNQAGGLSASSRALFSFRQKELDVLQAHLERFKSSLDLILGVLNLALSAKTARSNEALLDMRTGIHDLVLAERKARQRESQIVQNASRSDDAIGAGPANSDVAMTTDRGLDVGRARGLDKPVLPDISPISEGIPRRQPGDSPLLRHLAECSKAATKLASTINSSLVQWQQDQSFEASDLPAAYDLTRIALHDLSACAAALGFETNSPLPLMTERPETLQHVNAVEAEAARTRVMPHSSNNGRLSQTLLVLGFIIATTNINAAPSYGNSNAPIYLAHGMHEDLGRRQPSPYQQPRHKHSDHFLSPDVQGGGLRRERTQGDAPVPVVNVYNDSGSSLHYASRTLGEQICDDMENQALDGREPRSRSRGRSDPGVHIDREDSIRYDDEFLGYELRGSVNQLGFYERRRQDHNKQVRDHERLLRYHERLLRDHERLLRESRGSSTSRQQWDWNGESLDEANRGQFHELEATPSFVSDRSEIGVEELIRRWTGLDIDGLISPHASVAEP